MLRLWSLLRTHYRRPGSVAWGRRGLHSLCLEKDEYDSKRISENKYEEWERRGMFRETQREPGSAEKTFSMILPPPNVTGSLHIGHALTVSIEDAFARYYRMKKGHRVVWIPGCDHAGIATQAVVEKHLFREHGKMRQDYGREGFVQKVWEWKDQYGRTMTSQIRKLGASVDWEREYFTLDQERSKAVESAFVKLFEQGLIYRDNRIVNWSPKLKSAISDIEVDHEVVNGTTRRRLVSDSKGSVEVGSLFTFKYPVVGSANDAYLPVATTRPETILGDTGVAIHPADDRYKQFHGMECRNPLNGRIIPIVLDEDLVDMEFGTGAVKLTPSHDPNDYDAGKRHNLQFINILNDDGTLNENVECDLEGVDRLKARDLVVASLRENDLYIGTEDYEIEIPVCSRSGDIIEPLIRPQWFVKGKELAQKVVPHLESGSVNVKPPHFKSIWLDWMYKLEDWCISRQLWWGHQVPAYRVTTDDVKDGELWVAADNAVEAGEKAKKELLARNIQKSPLLQRDPDVLDTWFSSGLLPLSVFGWPNSANDDEGQRYPLTLMETGSDILFFWVARMALLCNHFSGKMPFENVLFHPIVRDAAGRKMSKSVGNIIDPVHVIDGTDLDVLVANISESSLPEKEKKRSIADIKKEYPKGIPPCGVDALRFSLCHAKPNANSSFIRMDLSEIILANRFCIKMWNIAKFCFPFVTRTNDSLSCFESQDLKLMDKWILERLRFAVSECNSAFAEQDLARGTFAVRYFMWNELADVYLEMRKPVLQSDTSHQSHVSSVLAFCLETSVKLAHPFMPFVSEEIWQQIPHFEKDGGIFKVICSKGDGSIMQSSYPEESEFEEHETLVQESGDAVVSIISQVRSFRELFGLPPTKNLSLTIQCSNELQTNAVSEELDILKSRLKLSAIDITSCDPSERYNNEQTYVIHVASDVTIVIPASGFGCEADRELSLQKLKGRFEKVNKQLSNAETLCKKLESSAKVKDDVKMKHR
eukprot:Nk52_evm3s2209 gene=Nk52_evmTU3s2209